MACWSQLLDQDEAVGEIRADLQHHRRPHAYLLEGMPGSGRLTLARIFAQTVLCETNSDAPCETCWHCGTFSRGTHPDYLELPRDMALLTKRRFVESSGGTEEIDHPPVLDFLYLRPQAAPRRVCVIPDAERMRDEAANAFLKTLEEPPGDSLILLTTSARDRILSTIVSRCRRVRVRPMRTQTIEQELVRREAADSAQARELALLSEGSLGAALQLAQGDAVEDWSWIAGSLQALTPVNAVYFAQWLSKRAESRGSDGHAKRRAAVQLLDMVSLWIRMQMRESLSPRAGARALQSLWTASEQLAANTQIDLVMQTAALETLAALKR